MKYLLVLLVLTACTAPRAETKQNFPAHSKPIPIDTNALENSSDETDFEDGYADSDNSYLFMTEKEISFYIEGRKYGKEYKEFFELQLVSFGTNEKGKRRVDIQQLDNFKEKYPPFN